MHIWLLTHPEELKKQNGTGQLVKQALSNLTTVLTWQRTDPPQELIELPVENTLLIYPDADNIQNKATFQSTTTAHHVDHIILLDGTWQQARKMYNRSPYLHRFKKFEIKAQESVFKRRRNQIKNGLCTAESVIYLLGQFSAEDDAGPLQEAFFNFNQQTLDHQ